MLSDSEVASLQQRLATLKHEQTVIEERLKKHFLETMKLKKDERYKVCEPVTIRRRTGSNRVTVPKKPNIIDLINAAKEGN